MKIFLYLINSKLSSTIGARIRIWYKRDPKQQTKEIMIFPPKQ